MSFEIDNSEMLRLQERLKLVVHPDRRLPEPVFQPQYGCFQFTEFDATMADQFWPVLWGLMRAFGDEHCSLAVLDPDPLKYFFAQFKRYGALRFELGNTADDYYNALSSEPDGSPADALLYNSEVIVWLPDSRKWAIWGERSLGIAVIAADEALGPALKPILNEAGLATSSVDRAVLDYVALNIRDAGALDAFSRKFEAVYGQQTCCEK